MNDEQYYKKEYAEWDEETPVYCEYYKELFYSDEDLQDFIYCHDSESPKIVYENLRLILCEPIYPPKLFYPNDFWIDQLSDETRFEDVASKELIECVKKMNQLLNKEPPWGYQHGNKRTSYKIDLSE